MNTSNRQYGRQGVNLEMFDNTKNNIEKSPDLMP
jgi:hypothetical protein